MDLVLAGTLVLAISPLLTLIALAVKLTSPGPIIYRHRRFGYQGRSFEVFKFRSMRSDADRIGPAFTATNDPRITAVGRILRKLSLDELPQLFNVLLGDMSLLGPRPVVGFELDGWTDEDRRLRTAVRPGISGLAQANGRSSLSPDEIKHYDLEYVRTCSLSLDCRLLGQTAWAVLTRRGVN